MAILRVKKIFDNGNEFVLGYVCQYPSGEYWFNPKMPHRKASRKGYSTPMAAIPRWAKNQADVIEEVVT